MNSMRSNLQFRIGGWETNPNMNLVIRTEDVLKRFERESIIHCTMNDEKKNSTEIETKILDKEKNSVMLFFYTWIKSHHMTTSQKKSRQGLNKEPMNTLAVRAMPKEIIQEEIMIRLPVKTLMMFKCVSKDWNDLISDDYFRRRYLSRQQHKGNAPAGFFCSNTTNHLAENLGFCFASKFLYISEDCVKKEELESFDYLFGTFGYVIASSKGLLLLGYSSIGLFVYDFVSKKHVKLPRNNLPSWFNVAVGFKCEKSNSSNHHLCYKVVCVDASSRCKYATRGSSYNVDIYSSETGTWRKSIMRSHLPFSMHSHSVSKVIGGVFHWPLHCLGWVVAYDSDNGSVALIELPSTVDTKFYKKIMRNFEVTKEGSLQFISIKDMAINVWTVKSTTGRSYMDEVLVHGSQWSLTSSVSLWDIGVDFIDFHFLKQNSSRIICADPVNLHIIYLDIAHQLFAYDCRQGKIVSTFSQEIEVKTDAFVHFEWPTWPCL